jgi:hypothetical protein
LQQVISLDLHRAVVKKIMPSVILGGYTVVESIGTVSFILYRLSGTEVAPYLRTAQVMDLNSA